MESGSARVAAVRNVKALKRARRHAILTSLKAGASITAACAKAGVTVMTFWRWRQANPRLERLVAGILNTQITVVEDSLYQNAVGGNVTAQIFYLTNRKPDVWKDRRALVNNINAIKIGDGKRVDREFVGEERDAEQRLIDYFRSEAASD